MRILLTGGGTGGHIYPGLSLWNYLYERRPDAQVLYIGSERGLERGIVGHAGLPFETIPAAPLRREVSLRAVATAWETYRGYRAAKRIVHRYQPDIVLGTGGYVTLPVVYAASRLGVPVVIWEANARPGLTNQLAARRAYAVAVCFSGGERWFPAGTRLVLTGNPRGSEVLAVSDEAVADARHRYGIRPEQKLIVGYMGSRGSETVNAAVREIVPRFAHRPGWRLLYVTGEAHYQSFCEALPKLPHNVAVVPFLHDMPSVLRCASAVVTRAGGATLSEICALGLASILIPSPYVTANHQEENAKRLAAEQAAVMLREAELSPDALWAQLDRVLETSFGDELRSHALRLATPQAVASLCDLVLEAAEARRR
ncbi:MAG: undecaprenyldiphospho-muramoylpentapeptide beta-N-acetylglucosaminyltransferase [Alicyclobacillus sp.]|nr:undecaprenyldiphospho-muramoylpentapeptide beta-N-acetylglucosaminyltransferase [Alicyclobacillus sp.]